MSEARARDLLAGAIAWDNHACLPMRADDSFLPQLERHRAAGFSVVSVNIGFGAFTAEQHLELVNYFRAWLQQHPQTYVLARSVADIREAKSSGRLAVVFDIEGVSALGGNIGLIQTYYDLGVRWMLLAYNGPSDAGYGCHTEDFGLTPFGRAVVAEMQRVGMVVCCSHAGRRTALDILERTDLPVIFSHSNPRAVWDHERNIDDELMDRCARTGGVVCINGIGAFLGQNDASTTAMVRAIDYAVQRIGPRQVGLGLDYVFDERELSDFLRANSSLFPPEKGYADGMAMVEPERLPAIVGALLDLGYADADVHAIVGGNLIRVAEIAWKA